MGDRSGRCETSGGKWTGAGMAFGDGQVDLEGCLDEVGVHIKCCLNRLLNVPLTQT
jgi:hypothetical protein